RHAWTIRESIEHERHGVYGLRSTVAGEKASDTRSAETTRPCARCRAGSADGEDQPFEVLGLRKLERDGVIGRLREALEDLHVPPRVDRGAGDDLLKECRVDMPGARERREDPAGRHELEREQVHVLVAACAGVDLLRRMNELRWIEHDEIVALAARDHYAQFLEHVALDDADVG